MTLCSTGTFGFLCLLDSLFTVSDKAGALNDELLETSYNELEIYQY